MIDINIVKSIPGALDKSLIHRNKNSIEKELLAADEMYKSFLTQEQKLLEERNSIKKRILK